MQIISKSKTYFLLTLFFFCSTIHVLSQTDHDLNWALEEYDNDRFHNAIEPLEVEMKNNPQNAEVTYKLGICLLHAFSFERALDLIETAQGINSEETIDKHYEYWHGRALHHNYYFDEAIAEYKAYELSLGKHDGRVEDAEWYIKQAQKGKEALENPKNFLVENLGDKVNTEYDDHSPILTRDGNTLIFTSKRSFPGHEIQDEEGEYYEKIFSSTWDDNKGWTEPVSLAGALDSDGHDACVQLYDDENKMLVHEQKHHGDLYYSELKEGKWSKLKSLPNINSLNIEADASISDDGMTMYFCSSKGTKNGDLDLFVSTRKTDGSWTKPVTLGEPVNTIYDENSPYISHDGTTLYFSSNSDKSIGGYDVFKSIKKADGTFSTPENLGFPINSVDHDIYYHLNLQGDVAYYSSYREGGYGELDIYSAVPIFYTKLTVSLEKFEDGKEIIDDSVSIVVRSSSIGNEHPLESLSPTNKFAKSLLSNDVYTAHVVRGEDTLHTESIDLPLAKTDGTSKEISLRVKAYESYLYKKKIDSVQVIAVSDSVKTLNPEVGRTYVLADVLFDYNKHDLRGSAEKVLDLLVTYMVDHEGAKVELLGHTDNVGSASYNQVLSQKRADACKSYVVTKGLDPKRVSAIGKGELSPITGNESAEERQLNRRTEIKIK